MVLSFTFFHPSGIFYSIITEGYESLLSGFYKYFLTKALILHFFIIIFSHEHACQCAMIM